MLDKSIQYRLKRALVTFVFCETLLISGVSKPIFHTSNKKWVVVIDAGHGGKDPGCHGTKYKEKDVALAVALRLGHFLEENDKNVTVIYTRKTDVFIPLNERAEIANRNHADFFICIHCNASPDKNAFGSATYVMGLYKSEGNLEVSKRENASVLYEKDYKKTYSGFDPNSDEGNILFAMYQNAYLAQSLDLSAKIQNEYISKAGRTNNGVKQAGFLVLWKTAMPSLLTEMGFLTNPKEETFIGSANGQNKIAECIFLALQKYIDEKEGTTFNEKDFNLTPAKTDSAMAKDTSTQAPDTVEVKPVTPKPKIVKHVTPATPKDAVKMQASLKALHPDSASTARAKKANDTIVATAIKKPADTVPSIVKKTPDATVVIPTKKLDDTTKIIYKVQFTISPKKLAVNDPQFKNVPDVDIYVDKSMYKYTSGHFSALVDAMQLQSKLRARGFKDAFVIAFKGKFRVPIVKGK